MRSNFAIIQVEVKSGETVYDFIERIIKERDMLVHSSIFDYNDFIILGEFNERAIACGKDNTKEDCLKFYNKCIDYKFVFDAYKYLGTDAEQLIRENENVNKTDKQDLALTIIEYKANPNDKPESFCEKLLAFCEVLSKDEDVEEFVILGCFADKAIVCKPGVTFEELMLQYIVNQLAFIDVKRLYMTLGSEVDFVIANMGTILSKDELVKVQEDFVANFAETKKLMKNRLKKKDLDYAKKKSVLDAYELGEVAYLVKDTEKFPKGTKVSVRGKDMLNYVIPVFIVGVGDDMFCVSPSELTKEKPCNPLSSYIDHTLLRPDATEEDITKLCEEAKKYKFASVCVNPIYVCACAELLEDTDVKVCTVISFPFGANPIVDKMSEAMNAIDNGATELDYVINIAKVKEHDWNYILREMTKMAEYQQNGITVKVILETCLLDNEEITKVCQLAAQVGLNFVKTSTGYSKAGANEKVVALMKETVSKYGKFTKVKASGGIRTKEDAEKMIKAGADRIGTSAGVVIASN